MKSWVPTLRILLILACLRAIFWILDANLEPSLLIFASIAVLVFFAAVWLYLGRFEPNRVFPCPHCGQGNIKDRRICKRCRARLPAPEEPQPEESPPMIQHWVDVEVGERPEVRG